MSDYNHLIGRPYIEGRQDCFSVVRDYYRDQYGIRLPNLARPTRFWEDPSLDLYMDNYQRAGFELVFDQKFEVGDVFLMPLGTSINTHAAVLVDSNQILHHLPNKLSCVDRLRPKWINRVMAQFRHPGIKKPKPHRVHLHEVVNAHILRDPTVKAAVERQMDSE